MQERARDARAGVKGEVDCPSAGFTVAPETCAQRRELAAAGDLHKCFGRECDHYPLVTAKPEALAERAEALEQETRAEVTPEEEVAVAKREPNLCPGYAGEACGKALYSPKATLCKLHANRKRAHDCKAEGTSHTRGTRPDRKRPGPKPKGATSKESLQVAHETPAPDGGTSAFRAWGAKLVRLGCAMQERSPHIEELARLALECGLCLRFQLVPEEAP